MPKALPRYSGGKLPRGSFPVNLGGLGVGQKDFLEGAASGLNQKWDCSQAEEEFEEGDVMGLVEDDEMMMQWEDVRKEAAKDEDHGRYDQKDQSERQNVCEHLVG